MELMGPKMLAETADMIGVKELRDAFKEVFQLYVFCLICFEPFGCISGETKLIGTEFNVF